MVSQSLYEEAVTVASGQGQVTFTRGAKIRYYFELIEDTDGTRILYTWGRFSKDSYNTWEQLVSRYQVDTAIKAVRKDSQAISFEGQNDDNRVLTIERMFLIGARATDVGPDNLTLHMKFECQDATLTRDA